MTTLVNDVTRVLHHVETLRLSTNLFEGRFDTWTGLLELFTTEPAPLHLSLLTGLSLMIRLLTALNTKVFPALTAPDSICSQVFCRYTCNRLPVGVLLIHIDLSWNKLHDVSACTPDEIFIQLDNILSLFFLDFS